MALVCELHYFHDYFRVSLGLACRVYLIRVSVAEGFTSTGIFGVRYGWFASFMAVSSLGFVGVDCGVFGSDFFRVPLGLAEGLSSSGFLWRRASLLSASLGLSCLGFAGFAGWRGSHFFMVSAGSA